MDLQIARNGEIIGVCVFEELEALVAHGSILPTDYGLAEGWPEWKSVVELLPKPTAPPLPPEKPAAPKDWRQDAATEKQIRYLADYGITAAATMTKGEASELIDKCENDPQARQRRDKIQSERSIREMEERNAFLSYHLRKQITKAQKEVEQAEKKLAAYKERGMKGSLREDLRDARADLKSLVDERILFWKWTFEEDNEDFNVTALNLYYEYGHFFRPPSIKQISDILEALDAASTDWDKTEPHSFFATLKASFPDTIRG